MSKCTKKYVTITNEVTVEFTLKILHEVTVEFTWSYSKVHME